MNTPRPKLPPVRSVSLDYGPSRPPSDKKKWSLRNLHMFHRKSVDEATFYGSTEDRERKAKSSIDLRSNGEQTPSPPPTGKKRKFWSSFRNKKRLLAKSRQKDGEEPAVLSASQPNISNDISRTSMGEDFDPIFDSPNKSSGPADSMSSPDRSLSDPSVTPGHHSEESHQSMQSHSEEHDREDEGDSGIAVVENTNSSITELNIRQRQQALMQHSFFVLEVWLREGRDLVVRDSCGTSDPYVKFKVGSKQYYKSKTVYKNLNPQWDERLSIPIEDVYRPVNVKVFDYDRGISDDPMGSAEIDLTTLELNT